MARIVAPGEPHHISQRGNNRQDVFFVDDDRETLVSAEDQEELRQIRLKTRTGRPLASDSFASKLEGMLGRRIRPLPGGRPKKGRRQKTR